MGIDEYADAMPSELKVELLNFLAEYDRKALERRKLTGAVSEAQFFENMAIIGDPRYDTLTALSLAKDASGYNA